MLTLGRLFRYELRWVQGLATLAVSDVRRSCVSARAEWVHRAICGSVAACKTL